MRAIGVPGPPCEIGKTVVVQNRKPSQTYRLARVVGRGNIVERRTNGPILIDDGLPLQCKLGAPKDADFTLNAASVRNSLILESTRFD